MNIDQEFLKSVLEYNPDTGLFIWRVRLDVPKEWNTRFAHKVAGRCIDNGMIIICINYKKYLAHQLAWLWMTDNWPEQEIDHKDLDRSNNRWSNLRPATRSQNQWNITKHKDNTSGYKGVRKHSTGNKWQALIGVKNKRIYLGCFNTPEDAHAAYCEAAKKYHGEFARY